MFEYSCWSRTLNIHIFRLAWKVCLGCFLTDSETCEFLSSVTIYMFFYLRRKRTLLYWWEYCQRRQEETSHWCKSIVYDRLRSASTHVIISNCRPFQILRSMADLLVRVRVRAYVSDVIGRQFEKVRNGHRFDNWTPIWEFEIGHRPEVQMSDAEIGHGFDDWTSIWVLHI